MNTAQTTLSDAAGKRGGKVTRADIEDKFRELQGDLTSAAEGARNKAIVAGGVLAVIVLLVVFLAGRRAGQKKSTVVEIRRL